ncbi:MAG: hypothetical protein IJS86_01400 [Lachnospiraceae bacterium]|nr:hypothetical protein [Lachnospiraceae bacterium]
MKKYLPLILAVLHTIISFFTDRMIFSFSSGDAWGNYIPCKILMFIFLYMFWRFLFNCDRDILKYSAIYLIPIIAVLIFKLPQGFLSNDERLIFEQAVQLADYTWFYYLTTWYYIITMMMIPSYLGPIIVKVVIQVLMCGYCVLRVAKHTGSKKRGAVIYAAFLLPPILAYTTSAHRIPIYIYLYLFLMFRLYMDMLEKRELSKFGLVFLCVIMAVLTQWRTEGIYLAVFGPLLLFIAYPSLRKKKSILTVCLIFAAIQYLVSIPQNGIIPSRMNDKAENRMGPFYAYTITNMVRNGLDVEKNTADLLQVDRYLDMETVKNINYALGDINYEDTLILYYPGYTGLRAEASDEDYRAYVEACKNIFKNNPDVLVKTRIGSFDYAATVYDIRLDQGAAAFLISIIKTVAYNLYIPMVLLLLLFMYSVIRMLQKMVQKQPFSGHAFTAVMTLGLFAHWFIVFVLAPASYFKYYFPIYFTVYFWYILYIADSTWTALRKKNNSVCDKRIPASAGKELKD